MAHKRTKHLMLRT